MLRIAGPSLGGMLCLLLLLASCESDPTTVVVEPDAEAVAVDAAIAEGHGDSPPNFNAQTNIPVPGTNLERFGAVGPIPVGNVPEKMFVKIEVDGTLSFSEPSNVVWPKSHWLC